MSTLIPEQSGSPNFTRSSTSATDRLGPESGATQEWLTDHRFAGDPSGGISDRGGAPGPRSPETSDRSFGSFADATEADGETRSGESLVRIGADDDETPELSAPWRIPANSTFQTANPPPDDHAIVATEAARPLPVPDFSAFAAGPVPDEGSGLQVTELSTGGGSPGGTSGSGATSTVTYGSAGGLRFAVTYDKSVNSAPAAFKSAFATAIGYFTSQFKNPITITLNVGWGEIGGFSLTSGALGESSTYLAQVGYSQLRGALATEAGAASGSADQKAAVASLPTASPIKNANYIISTAEAKALGLMANGTALDGSVGFGAVTSWDFTTSAPSFGQYYFIGVAEHEISEVMGRIALLGATISTIKNTYSDQDLFRYSAPGMRSFIGGQQAYLSFDGGTTNLDNFNNISGGDWGDWATNAKTRNDAYDAFGSSGTQDLISSSDTRQLNVLGYILAT